MAHNEAEEKIYRLRSDLGQAKINEIIINGLHEFLENFQADVNLVGQSIYNTYFALPMFDATSPVETPIETQ